MNVAPGWASGLGSRGCNDPRTVDTGPLGVRYTLAWRSCTPGGLKARTPGRHATLARIQAVADLVARVLKGWVQEQVVYGLAVVRRSRRRLRVFSARGLGHGDSRILDDISRFGPRVMVEIVERVVKRPAGGHAAQKPATILFMPRGTFMRRDSVHDCDWAPIRDASLPNCIWLSAHGQRNCCWLASRHVLMKKSA